MDQVKQLPCAKIVLTQSYAYMLETLQPGQTWAQYGFMKCITTNNKQKEYIEKVMRSCSFDILEPYISEVFTPKLLPAMPIIGIHTKDQSDAVNLIKTFYLRFPQYRWFTFRDLRGLSQDEFANAISECFVSVWMDKESAYGTFPLESMKVGVPVIGTTPNLIPEWMNETNGIWIKDELLLPDIIADWTQNWLEDNISPEIYTSMEETISKLPTKEDFDNKAVKLFSQYLDLRAQAMEEQISKLA
jgi:glycosyltransferase involved in cell wall biosynthesis